MSDLISKLSDQIYAEINKGNVASAASISPSGNWEIHIFRENFAYTRGANRGRLPIVQFKRTNISYENQVAEHGGQADSDWQITVMTRDQYGQHKNETKAMSILQAVLKNIHANDVLRVSNEIIDELKPTPWGFEVTATLTIQNSWLNNIR